MTSALRIRSARPRTRLLFAALASLIVFGGVHGFAASLGTSTSGLGEGSTVVASCGTGMNFAYETTSYRGAGYAIDRIDLSNIPAGCLNKNLYVAFYDSATNPVGSGVDAALPASGTSDTISVAPSSNAIDAERISAVSVVVS